MAAAWSFSRGGSQSAGSISRLVSTLSLDGDRLSADLVVHLKRALSTATAESVADEVAKAATEILGEQITQGEVPLSKEELVARVRAKISVSAAKITDIEVKSLYLFGSEVNASKSAFRTRPPSVPPPDGSRSAKSGAIPAVRAGVSSEALTPPPAPRVRTLWPEALSNCGPGCSVADLGSLLGPAFRDSVAAAVLHSFVAVDPEATDRMALFTAGAAVDAILVEVSACFACAAYRIFVSNDIEGRVASELVRVAIRQVLAADRFPAQQVGQYMASDGPVRDLAIRMASAIGAPETASIIQEAVSPYCEALRDGLSVAALQIRRVVGHG